LSKLILYNKTYILKNYNIKLIINDISYKILSNLKKIIYLKFIMINSNPNFQKIK